MYCIEPQKTIRTEDVPPCHHTAVTVSYDISKIDAVSSLLI